MSQVEKSKPPLFGASGHVSPEDVHDPGKSLFRISAQRAARGLFTNAVSSSLRVSSMSAFHD